MAEVTKRYNSQTQSRDVFADGAFAGTYWMQGAGFTIRYPDGHLATCYDADVAVELLAKNAGALA